MSKYYGSLDCKKCGQKIRFIRTLAGSWMPVNEEEVSGADIAGETIVTHGGEVLRGLAAKEAVGFVPHWATCPNAKEFRK